MGSAFVVQGMSVDADRLDWLRGLIEQNGEWSRKRLARELCLRWDWRNEQGRLKDFAARSFLLKLEAGGWIELPALREDQRRRPRSVAEWEGWREPAPWEGCLRQLKPVVLEVVRAGTEAARRWAFLLDRYHYLGFRVVGENLGYLAYDGRGRELACLLFGAAAWRCRARDIHLGWTSEQRTIGLSRLANNTRFLILPWIQAPHLASHLLSRIARRISEDWQSKYGHGLKWLETFVDTTRYAGTCYRAANWEYVGQTTGRGRQDREHRLAVPPKAVYLLHLHA